MNIKSLIIENFLSIKEAELADMGAWGLVLIQGVNKDDPSASSNGSGKSSLVDALCWCLYGQTARGVSGDEVVNEKAKKGTAVRVHIVDSDGTEYQIVRSRKPSALKVSSRPDDSHPWDEITKGTAKLTQQLIDTITGCPYEVFVSGVYAGQEAMPDLPRMTDKGLKELVEKAAGIDRLQAAHEQAKKRALAVSKDLTSAQRILAGGEAALATLKSEREHLKNISANWDEVRDHEISARQTALMVAKEELERVKKTQPPSQAKLIEDGRAKIATKRASLKADEEAHKLAQREVIGATAEAASITTMLRLKALEEQRATKHFTDAKGKIGSNCGSCGKPITEHDVGAVKNHALGEVRACRAEIETLNKKLDEANERVKTLTERADALSSYVATSQKLNELERALNDREKRDRDAEKIVVDAQAMVDRKNNELLLTVAKVNPHLAHLEAVEARIKSAEELIGLDTKRVAALEAKLALESRAVSVFGPAGVRAHILDTVTPYLNDRTAHYLSRLSDGNILAEWNTIGFTKSGELREEFNIAVDNLKGAKNFNGLSGGEKRKVRLACSMALQDLVATRATKPIKIFIADEIDLALDEAALERLMDILEDKARERGTVLVVSHHDLKCWISNVLTVTKDQGVSSVEMSL